MAVSTVRGPFPVRERFGVLRQSAARKDIVGRRDRKRNSGSASANAAPDWANRLRSEQAARAHRQAATQAIKDGDRPGNGANPSLSDKDD